MTPPIRIGIIGAGGNTRLRHIPGFRAQPGVEILCVANRSRASGEKAAAEFGIPRVHDHWTGVIADPEVDAVMIGTWPYLHAPATLAALGAGKHVLCEARMAMNLAEARAMYEAHLRRPELVAQIVPSPFTLGVDRTIRRLLAEGVLGRVLAVDLVAASGFVDRDGALSWRMDRDLSGLNVMMMGIWVEAMTRWVGPATRVMARARAVVPMRRDEDGLLRAVRIPDHLEILADLACGALAHLRFSAVTGHAGPPAATLYGEEATLELRGEELRLGRRGDDGLAPVEIPEAERGSWRVEEEFVRAIRGEEAVSHTTFADGVRYMAFTEAVHRSLAGDRAAEVEV